jgi:hypothetical protein
LVAKYYVKKEKPVEMRAEPAFKEAKNKYNFKRNVSWYLPLLEKGIGIFRQILAPYIMFKIHIFVF